MRWSTRIGTAVGIVALVFAGGCGGGGDDAARFTSAQYGYSIALDSAMTQPAPATEAWDGRSSIAHGTSIVDEYDLTNGDFFFAFGGPAEGTVREFVTERHRAAVQDHGCDESPTITDAQLDGAAALHLDMMCAGVHIQWLAAVEGGRGLVVVLGADASRLDENRATFDRLTSTLRRE